MQAGGWLRLSRSNTGSDRSKQECPESGKAQPLKVLGRGISITSYAIHALAISATSIVVGLNIGGIYGWDQGGLSIDDDLATNLLQFVAKLHEILIGTSISAIVLDQTIKHLASDSGLSLGLVASGYQAGSLSLLFTKVFWKPHRVHWTALLAASIIFANLAGPSSAVALIPRLDWWPVQHPYNTLVGLYLSNTTDRYGPIGGLPFSSSPSGEIYSLTISDPDPLVANVCTTANYTSDLDSHEAVHSLGCPGAGYANLRDNLNSWPYWDYSTGLYPSEDESAGSIGPTILIPERNSFVLRNLTMYRTSKPRSVATDTHISAAMTLPQSFMRATGMFWEFLQTSTVQVDKNVPHPMMATGDSPSVQIPTVQVQCRAHEYSQIISTSNRSVVTYPLDLLDNESSNKWDSHEPADWSVDPEHWNFTRPLDTVNFTWLDTSLHHGSNISGVSLGALITVPTWASPPSQESTLYACLFDARWAAANIAYNPKVSKLVTHNVTVNSILAAKASKQRFGVSESISISPAWASLLNVADVGAFADTANNSRGLSMIESLINLFVDDGLHYQGRASALTGSNFTGAAILAQILASILAEGLSRYSYNLTTPAIVFETDRLNDGPRFNATPGEQQIYFPTTRGGGAAAWMRFYADRGLPLQFSVLRYGYGYGVKGSGATVFAVTVLLMHAVFAVGYVCYSVFCAITNRRPFRRAWGTMDEMLALALVSRSAEDTLRPSTGLQEGSGWLQRVRIRERDGDGLELVVGGDAVCGAPPQAGKYYR